MLWDRGVLVFKLENFETLHALWSEEERGMRKSDQKRLRANEGKRNGSKMWSAVEMG